MGFWKSSREEFVNRRRSPQRDHLLLVTANVDAKRQEQMRRFGAVAVLVAALCVAGWALASGSQALAATFFQKNSRFEIRHLELHSTGRLTPAHIQHYGGLGEGQNLFTVNLESVRRKLLDVPLVGRVEITRVLPDTINIDVQERIALARIDQPGQPMLPVDRDGHLMSPPATTTLPLIIGLAERGLQPGGLLRQEAARDALALLVAQEDARLTQLVPIASVDVSDPTQIVVNLKSGGRALLGRADVERRLNRLAEIIRFGDGRDEDLVSADLTGDRNEAAVFKPKGGTAPVPAPRVTTRPRSTRG